MHIAIELKKYIFILPTKIILIKQNLNLEIENKEEEIFSNLYKQGKIMATDNQTNEAKYGGCEGPEAMYVKLISYDGHEFIIKREYALTSGTIKAMLSGPGR